MANKKLNEYVEQTRAAGYSDVQIKHALEKAGWSKKEIDECMRTEISTESAHHSHHSLHHPSNHEHQINEKKEEKEKGHAKHILHHHISLILIIVFAAILICFLINLSNREKVLPEACTGSGNIECIESAIITKDSASFVLLNNAGSKIVIDNVVSKNKKCAGVPKIVLTSSNETSAINTEVKQNEAFLIKIEDCDNGESGKSYKNNVEIKYINADNLNILSANILMTGKVQ
jgi:hypothetical protein